MAIIFLIGFVLLFRENTNNKENRRILTRDK